MCKHEHGAFAKQRRKKNVYLVYAKSMFIPSTDLHSHAKWKCQSHVFPHWIFILLHSVSFYNLNKNNLLFFLFVHRIHLNWFKLIALFIVLFIQWVSVFHLIYYINNNIEKNNINLYRHDLFNAKSVIRGFSPPMAQAMLCKSEKNPSNVNEWSTADRKRSKYNHANAKWPLDLYSSFRQRDKYNIPLSMFI